MDKPRGKFETKHGTIYYQVNNRNDVYFSSSDRISPDCMYVTCNGISFYLNVHMEVKAGKVVYEYYPNRPYTRRQEDYNEAPRKTIDKMCKAIVEGFNAGDHRQEFIDAEGTSLMDDVERAERERDEKAAELQKAEQAVAVAQNNLYHFRAQNHWFPTCTQ